MPQAQSRTRTLGRRAIGLLVVLLLLDQFTLHVLVRDDHIFGWPLAPYFPQSLAPQAPNQLASELRVERDAELGWRLAPSSVELDWTGGRLGTKSLPTRKRSDVRRILVLGGSVTLAADLERGETFCERLSAERKRLEVVNLATPLYGLDQFLLQLRRRGLALEPDEVWIALEPSIALVATTRFLPFVRRETREPLFKPRFALRAEDDLELLPAPATDADAMRALLQDEQRYRDELATTELWASTAGLFPVPGLGEHFFATKLGASLGLARQLRRDRALSDPTSEAFLTVVAVARAIEREVGLSGARLRVLLLPEPEVALDVFSDGLRSYGLEVHDFAELEFPAGNWSAAEHARFARALAPLLVEQP